MEIIHTETVQTQRSLFSHQAPAGKFISLKVLKNVAHIAVFDSDNIKVGDTAF